MSRIRTSLVPACLVTPLLVACGSDSAHLRGIDPAEARNLFPGSTRIDKTGAEVRLEVGKLLVTIADSSDAALHVGDFLSTTDFPRVVTDCEDDICTLDFGRAGKLRITLETLRLGAEGEISTVMSHRGVSIAHGDGELPVSPAFSLDVYSYGGWMEYNAFAVRELLPSGGESQDGAGYQSWSSGIRSNSAPDASGGSATWSGVMVGMDYDGDGRGNVIQGDADITVDFGDPLNADVAFTNVHDLTARRTPREGNTWNDVPITGEGTFEGTNEHGRGTMEGRFYGPGHEEAGGVFEYGDITGAFGAKRED